MLAPVQINTDLLDLALSNAQRAADSGPAPADDDVDNPPLAPHHDKPRPYVLLPPLPDYFRHLVPPRATRDSAPVS